MYEFKRIADLSEQLEGYASSNPYIVRDISNPSKIAIVGGIRPTGNFNVFRLKYPSYSSDPMTMTRRDLVSKIYDYQEGDLVFVDKIIPNPHGETDGDIIPSGYGVRKGELVKSITKGNVDSRHLLRGDDGGNAIIIPFVNILTGAFSEMDFVSLVTSAGNVMAICPNTPNIYINLVPKVTDIKSLGRFSKSALFSYIPNVGYLFESDTKFFFINTSYSYDEELQERTASGDFSVIDKPADKTFCGYHLKAKEDKSEAVLKLIFLTDDGKYEGLTFGTSEPEDLTAYFKTLLGPRLNKFTIKDIFHFQDTEVFVLNDNKFILTSWKKGVEFKNTKVPYKFYNYKYKLGELSLKYKTSAQPWILEEDRRTYVAMIAGNLMTVPVQNIEKSAHINNPTRYNDKSIEGRLSSDIFESQPIWGGGEEPSGFTNPPCTHTIEDISTKVISMTPKVSQNSRDNRIGYPTTLPNGNPGYLIFNLPQKDYHNTTSYSEYQGTVYLLDHAGNVQAKATSMYLPVLVSKFGSIGSMQDGRGDLISVSSVVRDGSKYTVIFKVHYSMGWTTGHMIPVILRLSVSGGTIQSEFLSGITSSTTGDNANHMLGLGVASKRAFSATYTYSTLPILSTDVFRTSSEYIYYIETSEGLIFTKETSFKNFKIKPSTYNSIQYTDGLISNYSAMCNITLNHSGSTPHYKTLSYPFANTISKIIRKSDNSGIFVLIRASDVDSDILMYDVSFGTDLSTFTVKEIKLDSNSLYKDATSDELFTLFTQGLSGKDIVPDSTSKYGFLRISDVKNTSNANSLHFKKENVDYLVLPMGYKLLSINVDTEKNAKFIVVNNTSLRKNDDVLHVYEFGNHGLTKSIVADGDNFVFIVNPLIMTGLVVMKDHIINALKSGEIPRMLNYEKLMAVNFNTTTKLYDKRAYSTFLVKDDTLYISSIFLTAYQTSPFGPSGAAYDIKVRSVSFDGLSDLHNEIQNYIAKGYEVKELSSETKKDARGYSIRDGSLFKGDEEIDLPIVYNKNGYRIDAQHEADTGLAHGGDSSDMWSYAVASYDIADLRGLHKTAEDGTMSVSVVNPRTDLTNMGSQPNAISNGYFHYAESSYFFDRMPLITHNHLETYPFSVPDLAHPESNFLKSIKPTKESSSTIFGKEYIYRTGGDITLMNSSRVEFNSIKSGYKLETNRSLMQTATYKIPDLSYNHVGPLSSNNAHVTNYINSFASYGKADVAYNGEHKPYGSASYGQNRWFISPMGDLYQSVLGERGKYITNIASGALAAISPSIPYSSFNCYGGDIFFGFSGREFRGNNNNGYIVFSSSTSSLTIRIDECFKRAYRSSDYSDTRSKFRPPILVDPNLPTSQFAYGTYNSYYIVESGVPITSRFKNITAKINNVLYPSVKTKGPQRFIDSSTEGYRYFEIPTMFSMYASANGSYYMFNTPGKHSSTNYGGRIENAYPTGTIPGRLSYLFAKSPNVLVYGGLQERSPVRYFINIVKMQTSDQTANGYMMARTFNLNAGDTGMLQSNTVNGSHSGNIIALCFYKDSRYKTILYHYDILNDASTDTEDLDPLKVIDGWVVSFFSNYMLALDNQGFPDLYKINGKEIKLEAQFFKKYRKPNRTRLFLSHSVVHRPELVYDYSTASYLIIWDPAYEEVLRLPFDKYDVSLTGREGLFLDDVIPTNIYPGKGLRGDDPTRPYGNSYANNLATNKGAMCTSDRGAKYSFAFSKEGLRVYSFVGGGLTLLYNDKSAEFAGEYEQALVSDDEKAVVTVKKSGSNYLLTRYDHQDGELIRTYQNSFNTKVQIAVNRNGSQVIVIDANNNCYQISTPKGTSKTIQTTLMNPTLRYIPNIDTFAIKVTSGSSEEIKCLIWDDKLKIYKQPSALNSSEGNFFTEACKTIIYTQNVRTYSGKEFTAAPMVERLKMNRPNQNADVFWVSNNGHQIVTTTVQDTTSSPSSYLSLLIPTYREIPIPDTDTYYKHETRSILASSRKYRSKSYFSLAPSSMFDTTSGGTFYSGLIASTDSENVVAMGQKSGKYLLSTKADIFRQTHDKSGLNNANRDTISWTNQSPFIRHNPYIFESSSSPFMVYNHYINKFVFYSNGSFVVVPSQYTVNFRNETDTGGHDSKTDRPSLITTKYFDGQESYDGPDPKVGIKMFSDRDLDILTNGSTHDIYHMKGWTPGNGTKFTGVKNFLDARTMWRDYSTNKRYKAQALAIIIHDDTIPSDNYYKSLWKAQNLDKYTLSIHIRALMFGHSTDYTEVMRIPNVFHVTANAGKYFFALSYLNGRVSLLRIQMPHMDNDYYSVNNFKKINIKQIDITDDILNNNSESKDILEILKFSSLDSAVCHEDNKVFIAMHGSLIVIENSTDEFMYHVIRGYISSFTRVGMHMEDRGRTHNNELPSYIYHVKRRPDFDMFVKKTYEGEYRIYHTSTKKYAILSHNRIKARFIDIDQGAANEIVLTTDVLESRRNIYSQVKYRYNTSTKELTKLSASDNYTSVHIQEGRKRANMITDWNPVSGLVRTLVSTTYGDIPIYTNYQSFEGKGLGAALHNTTERKGGFYVEIPETPDEVAFLTAPPESDVKSVIFTPGILNEESDPVTYKPMAILAESNNNESIINVKKEKSTDEEVSYTSYVIVENRKEK